MRNFILNLLLASALLWVGTNLKAQCNLSPVDLDKRISNSDIIIEGMVLSSKAMWDDRHHNIFTIHKVEVLNTFKGTLKDTVVYVATRGGQVGNDIHEVTSELELSQGQTGVFSLIPTNDPLSSASYKIYEVYASLQGFVKYDKHSREANGVFDNYKSINDFYSKLKSKGLTPVRRKAINWSLVADHDGEDHDHVAGTTISGITTKTTGATSVNSISASASISGFSPSTVQAGAGTQLTINGSGFGATQGSSYVIFPNANAGGASYISPATSQYISWSDTKIVVEVPTLAGTGAFGVSDGTNTKMASSSLTVEYSILNLSYSGAERRGSLVSDNGSGGYTFQMFTGFDANTSAKTDFTNLITQWVCATGVNWSFGSTTTTDVIASDGINVVRFDIGTELSTGVLGQATSRYSACGTNVFISELDIVVDDGTNYFYGNTGSPSVSQYDFYTVMLHEMGHAHQLGHVIDATKVMHYSLTNGTQKRSISTAETTGALTVITQSTASSVGCGIGAHVDYSCNPSVTLSTGATSIGESSGSTTVTATLSKRSFSAVTVTLSLSGTATSATDYSLSTSITVPAGSLSASITLASVNDTRYEGNETVIINVSAVTNGTESGTQVQTVTITDDETAPTVTLSVSSATVAEASGTSTVTATLSGTSAFTTTVTLALSGTATVTTDYSLATTITIAAGNTTGTAVVTAVQDALDEANETVIIDITGVTNGTENGSQQQTVTITDDDATPTVTLSASAASISETGGTSTITATLSAVSGQTVTVTLGLTGTATVTTDYTLATTITINAGSSTGTATLTTVSDALDEASETVIIDITSVTNGTENGSQQQTVTITDDDATPTVTLSASAASISETGGSSTITATLSAVSGQTVTVTLGLAGTATVTTDYTLATTITINAGSSTGTATLTTVSDALDEANETVIIDITGVTNGTENGSQQQTVTITDDDATPTVTLSASAASISETGGTSTMTATLSAVSGQTVTVTLGTTGTATLTTDYTISTTTITIAAGNTTGTAIVSAVADAVYEGNETVIVDVTGVTNGTESTAQQQTITIADDDAAPTVSLSVSASTIAENAGTSTVTATMSSASSQNVTVTLGCTGTATVTSDYTLATTITILAGSTTGTATLTAVQDLLDEVNETVIIDIASVTNAIENATQQQTVTITDDDAAPTVTLSAGASAVAETSGITVITATLSAVSGQTVTVTLGLTGTATVTTDYTLATTITINAGSSSGTATLSAAGDLLDEVNETVIIDVTGVTNGTESGTQQQTVTINDDDAAPTVTLSASAASVSETGGTSTISATLSAVSGLDVTITLGYSGTATAASDYTTTSTSITILAGSTTGSVTVSSVSDVMDEEDQTVMVDIASVNNGTENGTQQQTVTILDDDAVPTVTLNVANKSENGGTTWFAVYLSGVSERDVTVTVNKSGTATEGVDYEAVGNTVVIPAGATYEDQTITITDDYVYEGDETIIIGIVSVVNGTEIGVEEGTITITEDESFPNVALFVNTNTVAEGSSVSFNLVTATTSAQDITVTLAYSGTASGTDYTALTQVVIPAGNSNGSLSLSAINDGLYENSETVVAEIVSVQNGDEYLQQQETVTITSADAMPDVTVSLSAASISEDQSASIIATLSEVSGVDATVTFTYAGTATSPLDYTYSTVVVIPAGSLSASATLVVVDDAAEESAETIEITIAGVTEANNITTQALVVTIGDNDVKEFSLASASNDVASGSTVSLGTVQVGDLVSRTFTISNSGLANLQLTNAAKVVLSGADASYFSLNTSALSSTIASGANSSFSISFTGDCDLASHSVTVTIENNDADESAFTFTLTASSADTEIPTIACPSDVTVSSNIATVVNYALPTVSDNCTPTLTLLSGGASGSVFATGTTVVTYEVSDAAGNTSTCSFNVVVSPATSLQEAWDSSLNVYPNPTSGVLNVELPESADKIVVYDFKGVQVLVSENTSRSLSFDMSGYAQGVYSMHIFKGEERMVKKITVVK